MAEQPTSKPTEIITWATAGTRVEPTSGEKTTGFSTNDPVPYDELNWWRWAQGKIIEWIEARTIRKFDGLPEAIAATTEGDLFQLTSDHSGFSDTPLEKTSKGGTGIAIEKIATDGEQLYYTQNNLLVAATANPTAAVEELWNVDISAMGTLSDISADGQAVALVGSNAASADSLKVVARDGTVLFTDNTYSFANKNVFVDSRDAIYVYVNVGLLILVWDSSSGLLSTLLTAPSTITSFAITPEYIVIYCATSTQISIYDKAGNLIDTATSQQGGSGSVTDGRRWVLVESANVHLRQVGVASMSTTLYTRATGGVTLSTIVKIDGRYIYAFDADTLFVIEKATGGVVYQLDMTTTATPTTLACDGRYIWTNVKIGNANPNYLTALPVQRQGGTWRRCGDGSTATSRAKPLPLSTLAVPMDYI